MTCGSMRLFAQVASGGVDDDSAGADANAKPNRGAAQNSHTQPARNSTVDPAAVAIAREAREALEREKAKVTQEMAAMTLMLSQMEGPRTPPVSDVRAESDTYLSSEMYLAPENVSYVSTRPFSYIPGLENVELSVPVPKGVGQGDGGILPAVSHYKRLENIRPDDSSSAYKGSLKGGRPHGHGSFTDPATGDAYEGEWLEGLYHGQVGRLATFSSCIIDITIVSYILDFILYSIYRMPHYMIHET